jgi:hypothetical protein
MSRCTPSRLTSGPCDPSRPGHLVNLVHENDPGFLDTLHRDARDRFHVHELLLFVLLQPLPRLGDRHTLALRAALEETRHHLLDVEANFFDRRALDDLEGRHALVLDLDLDEAIVKASGTELLAHSFPCGLSLLADARGILVGCDGTGRQEQIEEALLRGLLGLELHFLELLRADHVHGQLDEVAHHGLDVSADIANLGELRRLDLDERRLRQSGEATRDLGLADAGWTDHQDVFRRHIVGQLRRKLLPAEPVPQGDGDGALGAGLPHDILVELGHDFAWSHGADGAGRTFRKGNHSSSIVRTALV